jgi:hypothetical protein
MVRSLRALLANVIDYAGLFPPARLPLDESIRNYARYRGEPDGWMLGRFICPAARLAELSPFVDESFREGPPLAVSALGRGGTDAAGFRDGLRQDVNDVTDFRRRHGGRVTVNVLETRLPAGLTADELAEALTVAGRLTGPNDSHGLMPFFEASAADDRDAILAAIAGLGRTLKRREPVAGFKLRCGGVEPSAFPSPAQVALTITAARSAGVPLKFTAGLHHPVRRHDDGIGVMMHGFLNVFVAGVLANARGLDGAAVREVIEEDDATSFVFADDGLRWRDHRVSVTEIEFARRSAVVSFGSCSVDEPRDDLRALGLL